MHLKSRNDCSFMLKGKHKLQNYISHVQLAKFWSMKNLRKKRVRCFSLLCICRVKRNEKWEGRQAAYGSVFAKKQMLLFMRHDKSIYDRGKIHNPCKHLVLLLCIAVKKLLPENNMHFDLFRLNQIIFRVYR